MSRNTNHARVEMVLAAIALAAMLPLLVLIGAVIAIESRGPILVGRRVQPRDRAPVDVITFRLTSGGTLTLSGRLLRDAGLDTLPALWNVVLGQVALADALRGD